MKSLTVKTEFPSGREGQCKTTLSYVPLNHSQSSEDDGFSQASSRPPSEEELRLACNTLPARYLRLLLSSFETPRKEKKTGPRRLVMFKSLNPVIFLMNGIAVWPHRCFSSLPRKTHQQTTPSPWVTCSLITVNAHTEVYFESHTPTPTHTHTPPCCRKYSASIYYQIHSWK